MKKINFNAPKYEFSDIFLISHLLVESVLQNHLISNLEGKQNLTIFATQNEWYLGRVVRHRSAKPHTAVRIC